MKRRKPSTPIQSRAIGGVHRENLIFSKREGFDYCGELVFAEEKPPYQYSLPVELKKHLRGWQEPTSFIYDYDTGLPRVTTRVNDMKLLLDSVKLCEGEEDDSGNHST